MLVLVSSWVSICDDSQQITRVNIWKSWFIYNRERNNIYWRPTLHCQELNSKAGEKIECNSVEKLIKNIAFTEALQYKCKWKKQ